jgi:hypothetical protein
MIRREPVLISTVTAMQCASWTDLFLDLHLRAVESYARRIEELLAPGFARRTFRAQRRTRIRSSRLSRTMASPETLSTHVPREYSGRSMVLPGSPARAASSSTSGPQAHISDCRD